MQNQSTPQARRNARLLRGGQTDSEQALWRRLRAEQLGVKFRRQHPLGSYVLDFVCLERRLVVELDGSQHALQGVYDARRDAFLEAQGFRILRFHSDEPLRNMDGVLTLILDAVTCRVGEAPTPTLPQRGRGKQAPSPSGGGLGWGPAHPQRIRSQP